MVKLRKGTNANSYRDLIFVAQTLSLVKFCHVDHLSDNILCVFFLTEFITSHCLMSDL